MYLIACVYITVEIKGVKKVCSALYHRISNHLKKRNVENCIFIGPVIPCDALYIVWHRVLHRMCSHNYV